MSTYSFHEGSLPPGFSLAFEPSIFNLPEFLRLQAPTGWLSFYVLDLAQQKATAAIHVHLENGSANSPLRAPFGSVESGRHITPRVLNEFLEYVEQRLMARGARELVIKCPPREYAPHFVAMLETFLVNRNFTVAAAEPGAVIEITDSPFTEGLAHSQVLRKRQAMKAGLSFRMLPGEHLDEIFRYISERHGEKGYNLSITSQKLGETFEQFPDRYLLSVIVDDTAIRAAAISVRVKENVLYNFLVNHDKKLNPLSPPILLMEGLYRYCQENRIVLFDLGTSTVGGKPKYSLLNFKLRMGARPTSKFSFYKKFD